MSVLRYSIKFFLHEKLIIWSDGDGEASDTYWTSKEFIAWLYNESPVKDTVVTNDRWGTGDNCKHGDFYTCADRYSPGILQDHKWENCMTIDSRSWGYRRNAKLSDYLSTHTLLEELAKTVSCGGNLLLNVGPTKDGIITPIYEERLRQMGQWLKVNGEGIYGTTNWTCQNDTLTSGVWYTYKDGYVYATVLNWPTNERLDLGSPVLADDATVTLLGYGEDLLWEAGANSVTVEFPQRSKLTVDFAWVLKFKAVQCRESRDMNSL